ncbi:hypothetical protein CANARDRAFT_228666 [[Candida] arabinofermentans NRRL YB-2248]|uniref:Exosome complex protein n=1 Tax=[Candida] arabinofermentans NRRL YB-2248 TaxID=983967 RepID=A0A1E4T8L0_9ASCO|nr:hypothetical protein CANARDRAFT_228666 [[Candida] arabinofermentans NRRL YB-2248]
MEDLNTVKQLINTFENGLNEFDTKLMNDLLSNNLNEKIQEIESSNFNKNHIKKAELYNTYSYLITSIYFIYLKINGLNNDNKHSIMNELNKVKSYINRCKLSINNKEKEELNEKKSQKEANEFIKRQLSGGSGNTTTTTTTYEPTISKVQFEGKHTKFTTTKEDNKQLNKEQVRKLNEKVNKHVKKSNNKGKIVKKRGNK